MSAGGGIVLLDLHCESFNMLVGLLDDLPSRAAMTRRLDRILTEVHNVQLRRMSIQTLSVGLKRMV